MKTSVTCHLPGYVLSHRGMRHGVRLFCLPDLLAILGGRKAGEALEVARQVLRFLEVHLVGYLVYGQVCVREHALYPEHCDVFNPLGGR